MLRKTNLWRGLSSVFIVLFALLITLSAVAWEFDGMINSRLRVKTYKLVDVAEGETVDTAYYKSDYIDVNILTAEEETLTDGQKEERQKALEKLIKDEDEFCFEEMQEGAVLLKNDNKTLPITKSEPKVSLFGIATHAPYYKATSGGATISGPRLLDFKTALTDAGFEFNPTLAAAYTNSELTKARYEELMSSCDAYKDAAIVMLKREGGESKDLAVGALSLTDAEKGMLEAVRDSNKFDKTILIVNSSNALELDWLNEYGIDACLWIGGPALKGFGGVANILKGAANPSGHLVDTYAADSKSAPAVVNYGSFAYTNKAEVEAYCKDMPSFTPYYLVLAEGIYTGYKYYETRYADCVTDSGNAASDVGKWASKGAAWNYADEVTFPFGYGLSYTTFSQTLNELSVSADTKTFTAKVTVKNTGDVKGKDVVELYAQVPYISGGVEKSAIQLVGFAKSRALEPNEEQTLTITVDKYLLASWDSSAHNGEGGYILDAGTYYFAIGDDVHDALNNVLAARGISGLTDQNGASVTGNAAKTGTWVLDSLDNGTYKYSQYTQARVKNQFANADLNHWIPNGAKYLSRSNWSDTYPTAATVVTATLAMMREIDGYLYEKPADAPDPSDFAQGIDKGITFVQMKDIPYDDELWDDFISQLTVEEMAEVLIDMQGSVPIASVAKPGQYNDDGPDGVRGKYFDETNTTGYINEVVAASAWNVETLKKRGNFLAEDCLFAGVSQLWSPGADLHRTPFAGRNFEYFSECAVMSYLCLSAEVPVMQAKGVNVAIKHLAANDQETNRTGVSTFMTEQTLRETALKGFEGGFTIGGALGTMTSFNRLGCTFAGHSDALQNKVLRGEWGFNGVVITDACGSRYYIHTVESLVNGSDMYCMATKARATELVNKINGDADGYLLSCLREANKHFYYAFSRSNLINGLSPSTKVVAIYPWWKTLLITLDSIVGALALGVVGMYVTGKYILKNKNNKKI
jgi:beta-glucosidase